MKQRRSVGVVIAAGVCLTFTSVAHPAMASERSDIQDAVTTSLTPAQVAPSLGSYKATYGGTVFRDYESDWTVCSLSDPDVFVSLSGMRTEVRTYFTPRSADSPQGFQQSQFLFSDATAAQQAFRKLQRDIRRCAGASSERIEGDTPEDLIEWQSSVTNGQMQAVTGVPTVTIENDWSRASGSDINFRQDEFTTYSRVGNAIIRVTYQRNENDTLTAAERRGVQVTTKAAIEDYRTQASPKAGSIQSRFAGIMPSLIEPSDIPSSLGSKKRFRADNIDFVSERQRIWLCDTEGTRFSDEGDTGPFIGITANPVQVSTGLSRDGQGGISEVVMDFATKRGAARAFARLRSEAKNCAGTFVQDVSGTGDEDGEPFAGSITRTFSTGEATLVGDVPSITIDMAMSVQINDDPPDTSGSYDVLSLNGSQVIWIQFFTEGSVATKQKNGVRQLAVTAAQKAR